jgi:hypothetical protein
MARRHTCESGFGNECCVILRVIQTQAQLAQIEKPGVRLSELDEFYGEAVRQFESGERRDDIWGKAFSQCKGDVQATNGVYVSLLALQLAREANVYIPAKGLALAGKIAVSVLGPFLFSFICGGIFSSGAVFFCALALSGFLAFYLFWSKESPLRKKPITVKQTSAP